jgi:hypothetical protein
MRRLSSFRFRLPAAVLAAAVLAVAAAGTAAAASASQHGPRRPAAVSHPATTSVTWHRLTLLHGWASKRSKTLDVANPEYAIYNGIVYLNGGLYQPAGTNHAFAKLPAAARPASDLYIPLFSGSGTGQPGTLVIKPSGVMSLSHGGVRTLASLSAISFAPAGSGLAWHALKVVNHWSGAPVFGAGRASYAVRDGIIYLAGTLHGVTGHTTSDYSAVLPVKDRPASNLYLTEVSRAAVYSLEITTTGRLEPFGAADYHSQSSLDGISFPLASAKLTWHNFKLVAGWHSSASSYGTGNPAWAVAGPIVYLAGSLNWAAPGSALFAFAKKPAPTATQVIRLVYTFQGTTGGITAGTFDTSSSTPAANAEDYTSLAAVSYPRNT